MKAEEMFKKLGYKKVFRNRLFIEYEGAMEVEYFRFDLTRKTMTFGDYTTSIDELKAVNKQCEELGWLDK